MGAKGLVLLAVMLAPGVCGAQTTPRQVAQRSRVMHAKGTFTVSVKPAEASEIGKAAGLGRMTIDKVWSGDISGTSKGEMTTSAVGSTMLYVALETVTATVNGKSGTFVFAHKATMNSNDPKSGVMEISVVPGTGTGELAGIAGSLNIVIDATGHSYTFDYTVTQRVVSRELPVRQQDA